MRRLLAGVLATTVILASSSAQASRVDDKIKAQQERIHEAHLQLRDKRGHLQDLHVKVGTLREQLAETNRNIVAVTGSLDQIQAQLHSNEKRLAWNQLQLDAARKTLHRHNEALNHRLVDAYEHGDVGYLEVLLSATSFNDFVERWDDIRLLIAANQNALRARKAAERDVATKQNALVADQQRIEQSRAAAEQRKLQLASLAQQRDALVAQAQVEEKHVAQEVSELEELSAAAESELEELIQIRQREEEARREAARRAAQLAGQDVPPAAGAPGALSWPASGPITSPFGMRTNPVSGRFVLHSGIDIGAAMGSTVTAPAAGTVIFAGWFDGYGNAIIIDHGGGMSTLYGHLSQIFVGVKQEIVAGQAIGAVGSTGNSTGPHLHFEVRQNGKAENPMNYLR